MSTKSPNPGAARERAIKMTSQWKAITSIGKFGMTA